MGIACFAGIAVLVEVFFRIYRFNYEKQKEIVDEEKGSRVKKQYF